MKIEKIDIYSIELPLREPFIISYASYNTMPAIIVKIHTNYGLVGYGESVPDEHVTGESVYSAFQTLKHYLIPAVIGADPRNIKSIHEKMNQAITYNGAAKAAIDIACYDILGKYSKLPIYSLLGGRKAEELMIPKVLSVLDPDILAKQAKGAVSKGYREIKMKLGTDPEKDISRVKAVREAVGQNVLIKVDINQGWNNIQTTKQMIMKLEPYQLAWIEQPIHLMDTSLFRLIKEQTKTPLMADESLIHKEDLRTLIEHRAVDYINIKLMKTGGIYPAYQLAIQAELFGVQCQVGSMVESSIASAAGFHLALTRDNIISTEISGPTRFTKDTGNLTYSLPFVKMTDQPGLGIAVDDEAIMSMANKIETVGNIQ